jgi:UDPglucose--hexose-1-phosphate uridylyltransferase
MRFRDPSADFSPQTSHLSEIRRDPVSGRRVIISPQRQERPSDFEVAPAVLRGREQCPFCPGHESETPPEIVALRRGTSPDTPGWEVRVVPNRYPALTSEGSAAPDRSGLFERMDGVGAHEVVIESPRHDASLATMAEEDIARVLGTFGDRIRALRQDARLQYVLVFKNHGAGAGATLAHPHSQIIGLPVVPDVLRDEVAGARGHFDRTGRCVFCDLVEHERRDGQRVVEDGPDVIALAPYAARFAHETWLLPKRHAARFEDDASAHAGLARMLKSVVVRLDRVLGAPPFNLLVHTAPCAGDLARVFHWHLEVVPRVQGLAGFEWGTGISINPVPPEQSAALLRGAQ